MKRCPENYGFQLLCLGCLRGKELKVSTEGAFKNRNNVGSVYVFAHAVTFSFSFLSHGSRIQSSSCCLGLLTGMPSQPHAHLASFHLLPLLFLWEASPREISEGSVRIAPLWRWRIVLRFCVHMFLLCTDLIAGPCSFSLQVLVDLLPYWFCYKQPWLLDVINN